MSKQERFIEEVRAKQSNTIWPDALKNSKGVDEYLWKGSENAPLVQRIGAILFGITFLIGGLAFLNVAHQKQSALFGILAVGLFLVGGKVLLNGFKRGKRKVSGKV